MVTNFLEARDAIFGRFQDQLNSDGPSILINQELPKIYWSNIEQDIRPSKEDPWFQITVQHTKGSQVSLGEEGNRKFERPGLVTVQIFVPVGFRGLTLADQFGKMAVDAFEGKEVDGIWFRNVSLSEAGPSGPWFMFNVTAEFTYEIVK